MMKDESFYEEVQALRARHRQAEKLLCIQRDLAIALGSSTDTHNAFELLLEATMKIEGIDCGGVYLLKNNELHLTTHRGLSESFVKCMARFGPESFPMRFVQEETPAYWPHPRVAFESEDCLRMEGLTSLAVIPVKYDGVFVAVLVLSSHTLPKIPESARNALETIAAQIGSIVFRVRLEEKLKKREQSQRVLFNRANDILLVLEVNPGGVPGKYLDVNDMACRKLGYTREEFLQLTPYDIWAPEFIADIPKRLETLLKEGHVLFETALIAKDGRKIPSEASAHVVDTRDVPAMLAIHRDITERKRIEVELRTEHSFRTAVIEHATEGLCVCHAIPEFPFVRFTLWNRRMIEITGYTMEEINRRGWYQTVYGDEFTRKKASERMARMRDGEHMWEEEWEITRADGERRTLTISTSRIETANGIAHTLALMHDITERKQAQQALERARNELEERVKERTSDLVKAMGVLEAEIAERKRVEKALRQSERRLRTLSSKLLRAQEDERRKVAREVHDSIGSYLTGLKMRLETALRAAERDEPILEELKGVVSMVQHVMRESRRIMTDLRPSILDDYGIGVTVAWISERYEESYPRIKVRAEVDIDEESLSPELKVVIFRVLQEAMSNAAKHSGATLLQISLSKTLRGVELHVKDNGRGFDVDSAPHTNRGFGLTSMRERVELAGGRLWIDSIPGEGTSLLAVWPANRTTKKNHSHAR